MKLEKKKKEKLRAGESVFGMDIARYHFYLFNILTEETVEILYSRENFRKMIELIVEQKWTVPGNISDGEFLERNVIP